MAADASKKIARVHTVADAVLAELGRSETYKAIMIGASTSVASMEIEVKRAFAKGLNEEQQLAIEAHMDSFELCVQEQEKLPPRPLTRSDQPFLLLKANPAVKFLWRQVTVTATAPITTKKKATATKKNKPTAAAVAEAKATAPSGGGGQFFGFALDKQMALGSDEELAPPVVLRECSAVLLNELDTPGMLTDLPGRFDTVVALWRASFERSPSRDALSRRIAATLLRCWLEELPEPLVPVALYPAFLALAALPADSARFVHAARVCLGALPPANRFVLGSLLLLFDKLIAAADCNQISAAQLADVYARPLCRPLHTNGNDNDNDNDDNGKASSVVALFAQLFTRRAELLPAPVHVLQPVPGYAAIVLLLKPALLGGRHPLKAGDVLLRLGGDSAGDEAGDEASYETVGEPLLRGTLCNASTTVQLLVDMARDTRLQRRRQTMRCAAALPASAEALPASSSSGSLSASSSAGSLSGRKEADSDDDDDDDDDSSKTADVDNTTGTGSADELVSRSPSPLLFVPPSPPMSPAANSPHQSPSLSVSPLSLSPSLSLASSVSPPSPHQTADDSRSRSHTSILRAPSFSRSSAKRLSSIKTKDAHRSAGFTAPATTTSAQQQQVAVDSAQLRDVCARIAAVERQNASLIQDNLLVMSENEQMTELLRETCALLDLFADQPNTSLVEEAAADLSTCIRHVRDVVRAKQQLLLPSS